MRKRTIIGMNIIVYVIVKMIEGLILFWLILAILEMI